MIDGRNFFDQPVKNDLRSYDNSQKISTGQGDKQPELHADPKEMQKIKITRI